MTRLRVASWNVHEGIPLEGTSRDVEASLWDALIEADVDIAALQEVRFSQTGEPAGVAAMANRLGMPYLLSFPLSCSSYRRHDSVGVALLSRYPLVDERRVLLPNPERELHGGSNGEPMIHDKGLISATVQGGTWTVRVSSIHSFPFHRFNGKPEDFTGVWEALAKSIGPLDESPTLVCGDFNTHRRDLLTSHLAQKLHRAITHQATHLGVAADDILFSDDFDLVASDVVATWSDHALCLAEFELSPRR